MAAQQGMWMNAAPPTAAAQRDVRVSLSLRVAALLILVGIFAVITQQQLGQRDRVLDEAREELARFGMVVAEQTGRAIETVDVILREVSEQQHVMANGQPASPAALGERLQRRIAGIRQVIEVTLADTGGRVLAATGAGVGAGVLGPEGMELIRRFQGNPGLGMVVGTPYRMGEGAWTVLVARPLVDGGGQFAGIVAAALNLHYFEDFYRSIDLGDDGVIMLHRRDGVVLAAFPPREGLAGTSYGETPPFQDVLMQGNAGTLVMDRPSDGKSRVVAVRALRNFPFTVNLSLAADAVLTEWRRQTGSALITGLVIAGTIGVLLLLIAGESRRVERLLRENTEARAIAEAATLRITAQMEERERAETALRQAQRLEAVGQLTGGVAHDFNNLLTVLLGNIEMMQAASPQDPVTAARLERMRGAAERGATLTDQLLAFARRQPLVPRAVDPNIVIRAMLDLLRSAIGSNIEVDLALDPGLWPVLVDTTQMELVILNLALNARDAMPGGGRIGLVSANVRLSAAAATAELPAGDYVAVRVRDAGAGMSAAVAAHAFEPFFTTKDPSLGSGLGLSQVYGVARQSGGSAVIESEVGVGTTVSVLLPRTSAEVGPISVGARILLVDDDDAVRTTTALILEAAGYVIEQADGAPAALGLIDGGMVFDLLLTDVAMPVMNGAELADRVRGLRPGVPIVFISGYADPNAIAGREMTPLVRKPFRVLDLTAEIEAGLRG
jgi:signal transduction histidine kinase